MTSCTRPWDRLVARIVTRPGFMEAGVAVIFMPVTLPPEVASCRVIFTTVSAQANGETAINARIDPNPKLPWKRVAMCPS